MNDQNDSFLYQIKLFPDNNRSSSMIFDEVKMLLRIKKKIFNFHISKKGEEIF